MKIAYCIRGDYEINSGGDVIQMVKTKNYLEKKYNLEIDIITDPSEITQDFAIVHVFNFSTYIISKQFIRKAVQLSIPVVSSPIYWDYSYASTKYFYYAFQFINQINESTIQFFRKMVIYLGYVLKKPSGVSYKFKKNARWMFDNSDFIAPNSQEEANLFLKWINREDYSNKIKVVFNATDILNETGADIEEDLFFKKYNIPRNYILQIGRIEFCKNQLNLIEALKDDVDIPIVFLGKIKDKLYYKKLKKRAEKRGNVYFVDAVPYSEVSSFFRFATIHVLLSLRESPGLVNIEALANNCPIVIADERFLPVETYFKNQPYIVNPINLTEVRETILKAYNERKITPFDFEKFSWDNVAKQTYSIYNEILKS
ncbi:MAG: glycosyltransferase [Bacteroidales bacterium]|nr:glycosyltransferase [Bacteroidales bacterium]